MNLNDDRPAQLVRADGATVFGSCHGPLWAIRDLAIAFNANPSYTGPQVKAQLTLRPLPGRPCVLVDHWPTAI